MSKAEQLRSIYQNHGFEYVEVNPKDAASLTPQELTQAHLNEVQGRARALAPAVCPTLSDRDKPACLSAAEMKEMLSIVPKSAHARVSRKALEMELTHPAVYWRDAVDSAQGIMGNALAGLSSDDAEELPGCEQASERLVDLGDMAMSKSENDEILVGDAPSIKAFAQMVTERGLPIPPQDRETLLAHCIMHSRVMNRAARNFELEAARLPMEAEHALDLAREAHLQPEILLNARAYDEVGDDKVLMIMKAQQDQSILAIDAEVGSLSFGATPVRGATEEAISKAPALIKSVKQSLSDIDVNDGKQPDALSARREINKDIFKLSPFGHAHQVNLISLEISASRSNDRQSTLNSILGKRSSDQSR